MKKIVDSVRNFIKNRTKTRRDKILTFLLVGFVLLFVSTLVAAKSIEKDKKLSAIQASANVGYPNANGVCRNLDDELVYDAFLERYLCKSRGPGGSSGGGGGSTSGGSSQDCPWYKFGFCGGSSSGSGGNNGGTTTGDDPDCEYWGTCTQPTTDPFQLCILAGGNYIDCQRDYGIGSGNRVFNDDAPCRDGRPGWEYVMGACTYLGFDNRGSNNDRTPCYDGTPGWEFIEGVCTNIGSTTSGGSSGSSNDCGWFKELFGFCDSEGGVNRENIVDKGQCQRANGFWSDNGGFPQCNNTEADAHARCLADGYDGYNPNADQCEYDDRSEDGRCPGIYCPGNDGVYDPCPGGTYQDPCPNNDSSSPRDPYDTSGRARTTCVNSTDGIFINNIGICENADRVVSTCESAGYSGFNFTGTYEGNCVGVSSNGNNNASKCYDHVPGWVFVGEANCVYDPDLECLSRGQRYGGLGVGCVNVDVNGNPTGSLHSIKDEPTCARNRGIWIINVFGYGTSCANDIADADRLCQNSGYDYFQAGRCVYNLSDSDSDPQNLRRSSDSQVTPPPVVLDPDCKNTGFFRKIWNTIRGKNC